MKLRALPLETILRRTARTVAFGVGMILAIGVAGTAVSSNALAQDRSESLVLAIEGEPTRLDPHTNALWLTYRIVYHVFESFVAQDLSDATVERTKLVPALATTWNVSEDKTVYTFNLRRGVTFHDGTPWNAEAAKFNFDRVLNKDHPYYFELAAGINTWWTKDIESYEVIDDYTFRVNLSQPNSEFLRRLTQGGYGSAGMVSPAAVEKYGNEDLTNNPVGTGPYRFGERVFGEKIVLRKNPNYWDEARVPKLEQLIFRPIVEVASRELALSTGQVDMIATPSPDSTDYLKAQGFQIIEGPVPTIYLIWLNFKEDAIQDKRVRQAMTMAIDRDGLCKFLRRGQCIPAHSILNFGGPGYDPDFQPYPYDPDAARKLLEETGLELPIKIKMEWTPGGAGDVNMVGDAEWIQRDFAKVGIDASIEVFDIGTYFDRMLKGMEPGTQVMEISWGESSFHWLDAVVSPDAISPNGYNSGYYNNPKLGELLSKARAATSDAEQVVHLRGIQQIVADEVAWIPLHTPLAVYAAAPNIKGFVLSPQHWHDFATVYKE